MNGMRDKNQELSLKNDELKNLSEKYAQAERSYNITLAAVITNLKISGETATLAPTLAKGDKVVADLRMKMLIAEGVLNACRESIKNHRGALDTYRSLLTWMRAEMELAGRVPEK